MDVTKAAQGLRFNYPVKFSARLVEVLQGPGLGKRVRVVLRQARRAIRDYLKQDMLDPGLVIPFHVRFGSQKFLPVKIVGRIAEGGLCGLTIMLADEGKEVSMG